MTLFSPFNSYVYIISIDNDHMEEDQWCACWPCVFICPSSTQDSSKPWDDPDFGESLLLTILRRSETRTRWAVMSAQMPYCTFWDARQHMQLPGVSQCPNLLGRSAVRRWNVKLSELGTHMYFWHITVMSLQPEVYTHVNSIYSLCV